MTSLLTTGDELKKIDSFNYVPSLTALSNVTTSHLYSGTDKGKQRAVQKLVLLTSGLWRWSASMSISTGLPRTCTDCQLKMAVMRNDGSASISRPQV